MNKVPYDINDRKELKKRLSLHFEPSPYIHISRWGFKKGCVIEFIPPQTSSGIKVDNKCLEKLLMDGVIEKRYDNALDIKKESELENENIES